MNTPRISICILAALCVYAATPLRSAQNGVPTIEPIRSFGSSVYGSEVFAQNINSAGDIAGYTDNINLHTTQGFVLPRSGPRFVFVHPNEQVGTTKGEDINDSGLIAGEYYGRPNGQSMTLGFFLSGDTYTDVIIPGSTNTRLRALNNAGDFAGTADFQNPVDLFHPYISVGGNLTFFFPPGNFYFRGRHEQSRSNRRLLCG